MRITVRTLGAQETILSGLFGMENVRRDERPRQSGPLHDPPPGLTKKADAGGGIIGALIILVVLVVMVGIGLLVLRAQKRR
jgi:hypothetical protein